MNLNVKLSKQVESDLVSEHTGRVGWHMQRQTMSSPAF